MNFIGHLVDHRGSAADSTDATCLGVMWSDLVKLDGFGPSSPVVDGDRKDFEEGLAVHQTQDAEFHGSRRFLDTCARANTELVASGLRRGPARAFSHVAYELRLDGLLLSEPKVERLFRRCVGSHNPGLAGLDLDYIVERLVAGYESPESVASVVVRILSRRPRLAIEEPDLELLVRVVAEMDGPVDQAECLTKLLSGL